MTIDRGMLDTIKMILTVGDAHQPSPEAMFHVMEHTLELELAGAIVARYPVGKMEFDWKPKAVVLTQSVAPAIVATMPAEVAAFLRQPPGHPTEQPAFMRQLSVYTIVLGPGLETTDRRIEKLFESLGVEL